MPEGVVKIALVFAEANLAAHFDGAHVSEYAPRDVAAPMAPTCSRLVPDCDP